MADQRVSTLHGTHTKYASLLILVVQNSALVLTMRYSRVLPGPRYLASTAVVISELLKSTISLVVYLNDQYNQPRDSNPLPLSHTTSSASRPSVARLWTDVFGAKSGFVKLLIPAVLYTLQNNLQFVAASNLDAATLQVTYQFKILTTAIFAVMLLRQDLSSQKWLALFILTVGVACVQIPSSRPFIHPQGNYLLGIIAVIVACLCSGFAGVYFEKVLKSGSNTSIWVRNLQLSISCLAIAVAGTLVWDGKAIHANGFFQGYNPIVVATICIQAAGGLIVAIVVKYADNILKGFATSLSIILSTAASIFIFNLVVTPFFLIGSVLVFFATYLYSQSDILWVIEATGRQSGEGMPMLLVENYDEKLETQQNKKQAFGDEAYLERENETNIEGSPISNFEERAGNRNFSPSILQNSQGRKDWKVLDELGQLH